MADLILSSERVVTPTGLRPATVVVRQGKVAEVRDGATASADVGDAIISPGLVDCHVHVNEPGRTEWEGFDTATRAAAAGGITTIVDMPLNCIPVTTSLHALNVKRDAIVGRCFVDTAFWGGVVPGNAAELEPMVRAGVRGFKCFLIHSGIDDFPNVSEDDLRIAMPILARLGVPLLVHAELDCGASTDLSTKDPRAYRTFLESRPAAMENDAIQLLIRLVRETGCPVHIVHLSSAEALPRLREAWRDGLPISAETCPHYLFFAAEDIPDGRCEYKCAPPIRERENQSALWRALTEGELAFVVSDHSPCTPHLKHLDTGDFTSAWGGISSLQLGLSTIWTRGRSHGATPVDLARWMSTSPARFVGLAEKGRIAEGCDADLIVWDPEATFRVDGEKLFHRHKVTPYHGQELFGVVRSTYLRGARIFHEGAHAGSAQGRQL